MNIVRKFYKCIEIFLESSIKSIAAVTSGAMTEKWKSCKQNILIMANGPSLNKIDISHFLSNKYAIACVNNFPFKHKEFWDIRPDYLFLLDPLYFDDCNNNYPDIVSERKNLLKTFEKITWDFTVIIPYGKKIDVSNKKVRFERINNQHIAGADFLEKYRFFLYKKSLLIWDILML